MRLIATCVLFLASLAAAAQPQPRPAPPPTNPVLLKELDRDIWKPFVEAFAAGKPDDYFALHSTNLVRVMADAKRVEARDAWITGTRGMFKHFTERGIKPSISFRFVERLANGEAASERGVFEFTTVDAKGGTRRAYSKFHVISRRDGGRWRIVVDYDSNEGGTITRETFLAAHEPGDYARY